ncbi:glycosyltransferase [Janibacter indicus]
MPRSRNWALLAAWASMNRVSPPWWMTWGGSMPRRSTASPALNSDRQTTAAARRISSRQRPGPLLEPLRAAASDNVRIATDLTDAQMRWAYGHARALVAASHEDFGLTPLEAGAFGRPTLALRAGGYLDTIAEGVNGAYFDEPTADAIRAAVVADRDTTWDEAAIRAHVEAFSPNRFVERVRAAAARLAS